MKPFVEAISCSGSGEPELQTLKQMKPFVEAIRLRRRGLKPRLRVSGNAVYPAITNFVRSATA